MKANKQILTGAAAAAAMVLLVLDSKTAGIGAYDGIKLCLTTVIPSLFPFLVLSGIMTAAFGDKAFALLRLPGKICRIPAGSEALLLTGLLGGYPVGAQCVSRAYQDDRLSRTDAQRMLGFCSNAGPAFIFGMTASLFEYRLIPLVLWAIHIVSALAVGAILPGRSAGDFAPGKGKAVTLPAAITQSVKTMGIICGWIVIFRVIIAFCQRWFLWMLPTEAAVLFQGLLELSNGCVALGAIRNESIRFILCSGLLAFGGLCVWMQTASVTADLRTGWYLLGKLLQTGISCGVSAALSPLLFTNEEMLYSPALVCFGSALVIFSVILIMKKSSSNRQKSVV